MAERLDAPGSPDRRSDSRLEILSDLRADVMLYQPVTVREVSRDGVLVGTTFPLHIDSLHDIRLALGGTSVIVKARVAHCTVVEMDRQMVSYRAGLEFVEPSAAVRLAISQFLDTLHAAEWRADEPTAT